MEPASDASLLTMVANGDRFGAVGLLYDRHGGAVWNAAIQALGDVRQAEVATIRVFEWMVRQAARLAALDRPLAQFLALEGMRVRLEMQRLAELPAATAPRVTRVVAELACW